MELVGSHVNDWSGGTRIGHILREFNVKWSRRVLAQGAHVLIMTDGLDRDDTQVLEAEMARLQPLCQAGGVAQPAVALCRLRGARGRHSCHDAPR
jgi:uncharacterized protein with von Willebrand factor type A (vWA) domain